MVALLSLSVVWSEDAGPLRPGRLDLCGSRIVLTGGSRLEQIRLEVPFSELRGVRIARGTDERLGGRATLLLERHDGRVISIAGVATIGVLHEVSEHVRAALVGA